MKKSIPALLILGCLLSKNVFAQQPDSLKLLKTYTPSEIDSIFISFSPFLEALVPRTYSVQVYKMDYTTTDPFGNPILASGALIIPVNPACHVPLASYQHGTITVKDEVPSTLKTEEMIIGYALATDGIVVCMPDQLGLGDSPGFHPYLHAETEGRSVADMLVVAQNVCDSMNIVRNGQLFLLGYSQGGHSTMAANQIIQQDYSATLHVTACAPMSGPYDMNGVEATIFSTPQLSPNPYYLPYFLLAYNGIYHLYDSTGDYLASPYASTIPPLFDGTHEGDEITAAMGGDTLPPNHIITSDVLDSFISDKNYPLHSVLYENDTYHWVPQNPLRMYYCTEDMDVNYMNAIVALDSFIAQGASQVSAVNSGAYDHMGCVLPSLLSAKNFFDSLRLDKIKLSFDVVNATGDTVKDGAATVHATGGVKPYSYLWSNGSQDSTDVNLAKGNYSVTVTDASGCPSVQSVFIGVTTGLSSLQQIPVKLYPNPMTSLAVVELNQSDRYEIEIHDASGRLMKRAFFNGNHYLISRDQLSRGVYVVRIINSKPEQSILLLNVQ